MPSIRLIDRASCEDPRYLDFGFISKYRCSGEICIDLNTKNESEYAVLAESANHVVGLLKFDLNGRWLISRGTWVSRSARRQGLATKMWSKALRTYKITGVELTVVSDRGRTLVEGLKEKFPRVTWDTAYAGDRPLRNLAAR